MPARSKVLLTSSIGNNVREYLGLRCGHRRILLALQLLGKLRVHRYHVGMIGLTVPNGDGIVLQVNICPNQPL